MTSLDKAHSIADLRQMARRRLPASVFDFIDGGAEDERTLVDNRHALTRRRISSRVLVDVSSPNLETPIFGNTWAAPFVVCPMGSCALGWPEADIAIARAAASQGIVYTLSTMSTTSIERMANAVQGRLWFQLYILKNSALNYDLIARAQAAGYEALVVTVDLPVGGKRERDLRNEISIPLKFNTKHLWEGITHPRWALRMISSKFPEFENVRGFMGEEGSGLTIAARVGESLNASYQWSDLVQLRDKWKGKLLVKGVQHPEDALRMLEMGIDGLWISNHGGRQLDGAIASADALPAIYEATQGSKFPVREEDVTIAFAFASVVATRDLKSGHIISREDITLKRPSGGDFGPKEFFSLIGKKVEKEINMNTQISRSQISVN